MNYTQVKQCINEIGQDTLEDLLNYPGEEVIESAFECDIPLSNIEEAYEGEHPSDEIFVENLLCECGEVPNLPHYVYVDWERTSKDVMMDYTESNGHYFRI